MDTSKTQEPTLRDVVLSINGLKTQIDGMQIQVTGMRTQVDGMQAQMDNMQSQITGLATKEELDSAVSKLDRSIRRVAGDLGESISSLTHMVAKEFSSLTISRA